MNSNQFSDVILLSQFNKHIIEGNEDGLFFKIEKNASRCYICVNHYKYDTDELLLLTFQSHYKHLIADCEILFNWCKQNIADYEISEVVLTGFRENGLHALLLAEQMRKKISQVTFNCVTYGVKYSTALLVDQNLFSYLHVTIPKDDYVHCPFYYCNSYIIDAYLGKKSFDYYLTRLSGIFMNKSPELDITHYVSYIEFYNLMHFSLTNEKTSYIEGKIVYCENDTNPTVVNLEVTFDTNVQDLTTNDTLHTGTDTDVPHRTNTDNCQYPWDIIVISDTSDHNDNNDHIVHS